jgi:hypothetical protein
MSIVVLMGRGMRESCREHPMQTNLQFKSEKRRDESLIDGAIRKESFNLKQDLGHSVLRCHIL